MLLWKSQTLWRVKNYTWCIPDQLIDIETWLKLTWLPLGAHTQHKNLRSTCKDLRSMIGYEGSALEYRTQLRILRFQLSISPTMSEWCRSSSKEYRHTPWNTNSFLDTPAHLRKTQTKFRVCRVTSLITVVSTCHFKGSQACLKEEQTHHIYV